MDAISAFIDAHQDEYVALLAQAVAIPSVSASLAHRPDVVAMGVWLQAQLKRLGCAFELRHPGKQQLEGHTVDLPPIILASYGSNPEKKVLAPLADLSNALRLCWFMDITTCSRH